MVPAITPRRERQNNSYNICPFTNKLTHDNLNKDLIIQTLNTTTTMLYGKDARISKLNLDIHHPQRIDGSITYATKPPNKPIPSDPHTTPCIRPCIPAWDPTDYIDTDGLLVKGN